MKLVYSTGGREKYYKALNVRDCVTRAVAISNDMDYKEAYDLVKKYNKGDSPRNGVYTSVVPDIFKDLGWERVKVAEPEQENPVYFTGKEVPDQGVVVCQLTGHVTTVIDGVLYDTFNCTKSRKRYKLLDYWVRPEEERILIIID